MNKFKKGDFVTVNVPISKYNTIPDAGYLPENSVYQICRISRKNPNIVKIYNSSAATERFVNITNCTLIDNPNKTTIKVGDVFVSTGGYDQTNVAFYKVLSVTKASVKVGEIGANRKYTSSMCGKSTPNVNDTPNQTKTLRLKYTSTGTPCFKSIWGHAFLWNREPVFFSEWH